MLTIITFNPSIDRLYKLDTFEVGSVQRAKFVNPTAGGKGLNVAKVVKKLGETPTCLGFLGGFNGNYIESKIEKIGLKNEFTKIYGETRICLNIIDKNGVSTEVLEKGPIVNDENIKIFEDKLEAVLKDTKVLVASGSLLSGLPKEYYSKIGKLCNDKGIKFILDTSGKPLELALDSNIYLIKPNQDELEYLTKSKINSKEDAINAARNLIDRGIENVCVSMGKDGMILLNKDSVYEVEIPKIDVLNPVGSGDSSIAGFAYGVIKNYDLEECLKLANACGMSNALYMETGNIELDDIKNFKSSIKINKYKNSGFNV
ncbi:1-phosphofructokinase [Clostridium sp. CCUG 7971]|uniref:1-phosphofructokinase n=1 Tax=Clostridium sp. CCUG 7971 TaxID=2811414 RepID=UPI001ABB1B76|nr:1-phosphofructokinase [Clostridium sp. CCUG 7971]MBO3444872.1 1-phosphofructokinase [Clostridium sp. CCUG 7971]